MDWYSYVKPRLGDQKDRTEVNKETTEMIVQGICNVHKISYTNPDPTVINFVVYKTLEELYLVLASSFGSLTKITVADGVTTDLSKPVESFSALAEMWHEKAEKEKLESDGLVTGYGLIEQTRITNGGNYYAREAARMNKPTVDIREGITYNHILWDEDDSDILKQVDVYINGSETSSYTTTSRYETMFAVSNATELTSVRVVKTDIYDITVETEVTL